MVYFFQAHVILMYYNNLQNSTNNKSVSNGLKNNEITETILIIIVYFIEQVTPPTSTGKDYELKNVNCKCSFLLSKMLPSGAKKIVTSACCTTFASDCTYVTRLVIIDKTLVICTAHWQCSSLLWLMVN